MAFTAKDVQALRQATGAGMMDAKTALETNDGDIEAAKQWLREQGLAASAKRDDRENTQGVVALVVDGRGRRDGRAEVRDRLRRRPASTSSCEAQELAQLVAAKGDGRGRRAPGPPRGPQDHAQGEDRARPRRAPRGAAPATSSTATCTSRAVGASTACSSCCPAATPAAGPRRRRARRLRPAEVPRRATTCRPTWSTPSARRWRRSPATRASPSRRCRRSSRVACSGFFKTVALLDQPYAKDDKQTIAQLLGGGDDRRLRPGRDRLTRGGRPALATGSSSSRPVRRSPGRRGSGLDAATLDNTAHDIIDLRQELDVDVAVVVGGGNFWRGRTGAMAGHGRHPVRPHRHARHGDERARPAGRARAARPADPGAVGDRDAADRRAVHPPPGRAPPGEGPGRDLRRRHRATRSSPPTRPLRCACAEIDAEALLKGTHSGVDGVYDADPRTTPTPSSTTRSATWT